MGSFDADKGDGMKAIRKEQIAVIIVIALQLIFMVYWGTQKSGYYVDEFFTYDNAHYLSASTPKRIKLYDADFLTYDEWHEISDLKSTMTVTREEALLADSAGYNLKMWFTRYPYMVLLNYVQAIFFEGRLSKWSAISLNILLFLLNQVILYRLTAAISRDKMAAVLAVALYGFTGMAASMTVYVRFYMLVTLWMTLCTYLHVLMWQENHLLKNLFMEFLAVLVLYLAYKDSPLAAIQGVGLVCAFLVGLLIRKRYRQAAVYGLPIVGGGLGYILLQTDYIGYILQPEKYADADVTNVATAGLLDNFLALTPGAAVERTIGLAHIVCRYLFGHALVLGVYLLLAAGLILWCLCAQKGRNGGRDWMFFLLAVCPCAFYCVVSVCLELDAIRYNSSIFPELAVCAAVFVMCLAARADRKRLTAAVMGIVILAAAAATAYLPRVENLYREDKQAVAQIQSYQGVDSVVVDYHFDDRIMYECLVYAGEDTEVLFTKRENVDYDAWHNDVLLWLRADEGRDIIEELAASGRYTVVEVGSTHESDVYFVSKHAS
ncbi:MAG: hypothetical protein K2I96_07130 [Lachnospiraceae bacterium]|nr:hypothetical protein [Lachnospiraceae bacterium]